MKDTAVVITGAFGNLGTAVARVFAARGARLALLGRSMPPPALRSELAGAELLQSGVDLTDLAAAATAMETVRSTLGGIDVLVNVAGGFRWQTFEQGDLEGWDAMYAINLKTALTACKAALPQLLRSRAGRIVNVGAAAALRAGNGVGAYAASKAGVLRLTESLAEELKDRGITVNAVLPGTLDTPQNRAEMPDADPTRWVAPAAVAEVIAFLASEAAAAVTGAAVPVTGRG